VGVSTLAQSGIAGATGRIALDGDPGPVIQGQAEADMGGAAHGHDEALAAPAGHGCHAAEVAQGVIVAARQGLGRLAE
jgi:hypothetical protein